MEPEHSHQRLDYSPLFNGAEKVRPLKVVIILGAMLAVPVVGGELADLLRSLVDPFGMLLYLIVVVGSLFVLLGGGLYLFNTYSRRPERVLSNFARANSFEAVRSVQEKIRLFEIHIDTSFMFVGAKGGHANRNFELGVASLSSDTMTEYGSLNIRYFGLLTVVLDHRYAHLVLDKLRRNWAKDNTAQIPDKLPGLEQLGYVPYAVQDNINPLPDVSLLAQFAGEVGQIADVDIEIDGDKIYFVQKDGLTFTKDGFEKFFKLIELVDIFDKA